ncbi:LOW QUALITY PROTEIN: uncharacterized protein C1orf127 homolog [Megaptera novaeangliae]
MAWGLEGCSSLGTPVALFHRLAPKTKANYRLETKIFQRGVKRLEQSDCYIMKCPVIASRLGQESVHCRPTFIQLMGSEAWTVSEYLLFVQTPWLLCIGGEPVASLGDASLMGSSTRQALRVADERLLQSRIQLVVLIVVAGTVCIFLCHASFPIPVSSQPEMEAVHIPKQRLDLVKRGSYLEESLSLKFRVPQFLTFTVTENRDFAAVGVLAAGVIQVQQCQEAQGALGTQAFYRVVLSLGFAEVAAPILWSAESSFQGSQAICYPKWQSRPEQSPALPGSPLLLEVSQGDVAADQPMRGPWQASKEVQPLTKPLVTSLAEKVLCSRGSPGEPQETSSRVEAGGPPREARGHLGLSFPEPSQDLEGTHPPSGDGCHSTAPVVNTSKVWWQQAPVPV